MFLSLISVLTMTDLLMTDLLMIVNYRQRRWFAAPSRRRLDCELGIHKIALLIIYHDLSRRLTERRQCEGGARMADMVRAESSERFGSIRG
jgi:hypothetical protein